MQFIQSHVHKKKKKHKPTKAAKSQILGPWSCTEAFSSNIKDIKKTVIENH